MSDIHWLVPTDPTTKTIVIFIHGLGGDPLKTWTAPNQQIPWSFWLAEDFPGTAIASVQYETHITKLKGGGLTIREYARQLHPYLMNILGSGTANIVFVCHSLGGLITKKILIEKGDTIPSQQDGRSLWVRTKAIAFFATPHGGASIANIATRLKFLIWPTQTLRYLKSNNDERFEINAKFRNIYDTNRFPVLSLYETRRSLLGWVVDKPSNDPGLPGVDPIAISNASHFSIVKPESRQDPSYQNLQMFLSGIMDPVVQNPNIKFGLNDVPKIAMPPTKFRLRVAARITTIFLIFWIIISGLRGIYEDIKPLAEAMIDDGVSTYQAFRISFLQTELFSDGIGPNHLSRIVEAEDVNLGTDPDNAQTRLYELQNRYDTLLQAFENQGSFSDIEDVSYRERVQLDLQRGNLTNAERIIKAVDLRRDILSQIEFRPAVGNNVDLGALQILNGWDRRNLDTVEIPQLRDVPLLQIQGSPFSGVVTFNTNGIAQLQAAFDEAGTELTTKVATSWCGSYVPRLMRGSSTRISTHTFGTSFDIACDRLRFGHSVDLTEHPDLDNFVRIFESHGFLWGGHFSRPDPMHFELYEFR